MSAPRAKRVSKLPELRAFDKSFLAEASTQNGSVYDAVLGVDEVGRGSIIGPVIAATAIFPAKLSKPLTMALTDLDDSKAAHLNHEKRVFLAEHLKSICPWGLAEATQQEVESLNVVQASLLASHRAILDLLARFPETQAQHLLVMIDGKMRIQGLQLDQKPCVKADGKSASVAAASIIAKAHRDTLVKAFAEEYPGYHWDTNAGYPTPPHKEALRTLGVTPLHRRTYQAVREVLELEQLTLLTVE